MAMRTVEESRGKIGRGSNGQADYFRFLLRMPQDMARKIDARAKEVYCPMNPFILRMLKEWLDQEEAADAEAQAEEEARSSRSAR